MEPLKQNAIPQVGGAPGQLQTGQWAGQGQDGLTMAGPMGRPTRPVNQIGLSNGLKFEIQEPSASDTYRMAKVLHGVPPEDLRHVYAMALFSIVAFNGKAVRKPESELDILVLLEQFGPAHIFAEFLEAAVPILNSYRTPDKEVLKNLSGTPQNSEAH